MPTLAKLFLLYVLLTKYNIDCGYLCFYILQPLLIILEIFIKVITLRHTYLKVHSTLNSVRKFRVEESNIVVRSVIRAVKQTFR